MMRSAPEQVGLNPRTRVHTRWNCESQITPGVCLPAAMQAVSKINQAVRRGEARQTCHALMNPHANLPDIDPSAAELYQNELACLQKQCPQVGVHSSAL